MTLYHNILDPAGYLVDESIMTFAISGTVTAADIGKAVSVNTAAANTMKIAAADDRIIGRLETLEIRPASQGGTVGAVSFRFIQKFPVQAADTLAIGDTAVAGTAGTIKKAPANLPHDNFVSAVSGGIATLVKL
jgi:hypothetical protein